jgi:hypothetical protein
MRFQGGDFYFTVAHSWLKYRNARTRVHNKAPCNSSYLHWDQRCAWFQSHWNFSQTDSLVRDSEAERIAYFHASLAFPKLFVFPSLPRELFPRERERFERSIGFPFLGETEDFGLRFSLVGHSLAKWPTPSHSKQHNAALVCALLVLEASDLPALFLELYYWLHECFPTHVSVLCCWFSLPNFAGPRECDSKRPIHRIWSTNFH